jgi:hypothetical protein
MAFGDQIYRQTKITTVNTMNALSILKKMVSLVTPNMHAHRRMSFICSIESLINGSSATVTNLGRGLKSKAKEKHRIKRADRLLSNRNLQQESFSIYRALARFTVGKATRPIILVDWSDLDEHKSHFLLRATLASHGRGVCIYEEVHGIKTKEKPSTHTIFLQRLAQILPGECKPIIVSDAGFKTPWFRSVLAQGWDFVGRTRLPNFYSLDDENWQSITNLYKTATTCPTSYTGAIARSNPLNCQLVLFKGKVKGRHAVNRSGQIKQSKHSKVHSKSAHDPWLLTSSLPQGSQLAKRVVKIYRLRMQIEEGFRDMKSHRYGQGFEYNKTTDTKRLAVLILLTTITHWVLMAIGLATKNAKRHRQYQANSLKTDNVLSLHFIGLRVIADRYSKLTVRQFLTAVKQLHLTGGAYLFETY